MRKLGNPQGCCCTCVNDENHLCIAAWSIGAYCDIKAAGTTACNDLTNVVGAIEDAQVTIERVWRDVYPGTTFPRSNVEPFASGLKTAANGRVCIDLPPTLSTPTDAPSIDGAAGGASGGTLPVGTYRAAYSHLNHHGETPISAFSNEFQIGVPDPSAYPIVSAPIVSDTGARSGLLPIGFYYGKITYFDSIGETTATAPIAFHVGMPDPSASPTLRSIGTGGALAPGSYGVRWAFTDGTHYATPVDLGTLNVVSGTSYGLAGPFAIPAPATGLSVWLSDDGGATWRRYLHNQIFVTDVSSGLSVIGFGGTFGGAAGIPTANDFPVRDPRLSFSAGARPNASGIKVYISKTTTNANQFYLYASNVTTDTFDLLTDITGAIHPAPTANTTAKTIPRATFTRGDGYADRFYVKPAPVVGTGAATVDVTTQPANLTGTVTTRVLPTVNTSGWGRYRITVAPSDSNKQIGEITVGGKCNTFNVGFGFCAFKTTITVAGGADTFDCHNINSCTSDSEAFINVQNVNGVDYTSQYVAQNSGNPFIVDSSGVSNIFGPCYNFLPCPTDSFIEYNFCNPYGNLKNPQVKTTCKIKKYGYYDRDICYHMDCGIPAVNTEVSTVLYDKANYIQMPCVANPCDNYSGRDRSIIPKKLYVAYSGPDGLTGNTSEQTIEVNYNASKSVGGKLVYESDCFVSGGWGICNAPHRFQVLAPAPPYSGRDCDVYGTVGTHYKNKVYYKSSKVTVVLCGESSVVQYDNTRISYNASVSLKNYWNEGCNDADDNPPYCGWDYVIATFGDTQVFAPMNATGAMILCSTKGSCGVGLIPIGDFDVDSVVTAGSVFNYFPTKEAGCGVANIGETGIIQGVHGPVNATGNNYTDPNQIASGGFRYVGCDTYAIDSRYIGFSARVYE
jgi:hypothetical protein